MPIGKRYIGITLILLISCLSLSTSQAQKAKKKRSANKELTEKEKRGAEYLFTEAEKFYLLEDYAKSVSLFQKCLALTPDNATVYYKLAEIATAHDELEKAQKYALKALELDRENKYFYLLAAKIHTQQNQFKEASDLYEEMIAKTPHSNDYLYELAALYLYQERADDALATYDRAEEVLGVNEQVAFQKQKIYLLLNEFEKAVKEGEKLIVYFPDEPMYRLALADVLIPNGRVSEAIDLLENMVVAFPYHGEAKLKLIDLLRLDGQLERADELLMQAFEDPNIPLNVKVQVVANKTYQISQARAAYTPNVALEKETKVMVEQLIALHPNESNAYAVEGDLLYALNKKEEARKSYEKTVQLNEDNFQVWQNILQLDSELNDNAATLLHAEQAIEVFPNQSVVYMYYGLAQYQQKDFDEAIVNLEQGKRLSGSNQAQRSVFNSLLGNVYHAVKDYDKSDRAYDKALQINPNDYQTLNNYSYYLSLRKDKLELAEEMAEKVVLNNPDNATYIDTYAWVLYSKGKYQDAKKQIEKALALQDVNAKHYEHYGDILYQLGKVEAAVAQWEKAKRMDASLENIDKKIAERKIDE